MIGNCDIVISTEVIEHLFLPMRDHGHVKFWSKHTLTPLLEEVGFDVMRFHGVGRVPYLWKNMVVLATKRELLRDADTRS